MKKKYIISLLLSLVMFSGVVGAETFDYLEEEPFDVVFDLTNDDVNEIIDEQLFFYFLTYDKNKEFSVNNSYSYLKSFETLSKGSKQIEEVFNNNKILTKNVSQKEKNITKTDIVNKKNEVIPKEINLELSKKEIANNVVVQQEQIKHVNSKNVEKKVLKEDLNNTMKDGITASLLDESIENSNAVYRTVNKSETPSISAKQEESKTEKVVEEKVVSVQKDNSENVEKKEVTPKITKEEVEKKDEQPKVLDDNLNKVVVPQTENVVDIYKDKDIVAINEKINKDNTNLSLYYKRATIYMQKGLYLDAIKEFNFVLDYKPMHEGAYFNRAISKYRINDTNGALDDLRKAIGIKPSDYAYIACGNIKSEYYNDYNSAIENFTKAIELNPKSKEAFYNRGLSYMKLGKYLEAKEDFNKVLTFVPNDVDTNTNLGLINDKLKDYKSAIYHYDKVLTGTSADYKIYFAIGVDCINLKDYQNAIVAFSKCIECDNKKKDAY